MNRLITLILGLVLAARLGIDRLTAHTTRHDERGSVTIEHVLWAVAVIGICTIVVAAIKAYVTSESGNIQ